jgi:hypothetical protein
VFDPLRRINMCRREVLRRGENPHPGRRKRLLPTSSPLPPLRDDLLSSSCTVLDWICLLILGRHSVTFAFYDTLFSIDLQRLNVCVKVHKNDDVLGN